MNQKPLVSILIPTHRSDLLKHSLASALAQTYSNTEIIVSDNSEGDEIRQMCAQHPEVRYYRNPRPTKTDFWMNHEAHKSAMQSLYDGIAEENIDISTPNNYINLLSNAKIKTRICDGGVMNFSGYIEDIVIENNNCCSRRH